MSSPQKPRVLLIGWDAADWKLINPLLDSGRMPALESLINRGVVGNLTTMRPVYSPLLWNSIATGKYPDRHGILGFVEPDPDTGGIRPISSTSRKVKAIWNILTQQGLQAHQVGWFASHPAEPISGVSVSNTYPLATRPLSEPWPMPPGAVHPDSLAETFAAMRMHPAEVSLDMALPFMPRLRNPDPESPQLRAFCRNLAETVTIHNAVTWILENREWDFVAAYYIGIDHFSHMFMTYYPPKPDFVSDEQFELFGRVMDGVYQFYDMLLDRLLQLAGPDTTVMLVSDHGFHSDHLRPTVVPNEPAGPAVQHRMHGIFAAAGPEIRRDERVYGARLLDVAPTILTLFGLPVGEDMDGRPLGQIFRSSPRIERIPSWESVPGECGMHPEYLRVDTESAMEAVRQLADLGYIEEAGEDDRKMAELAAREQRYNLALVYLFSRRAHLAVPILEELARDWPEELRFAQHLARSYNMVGRADDGIRVLQTLPGQDQPGPWTDWIAAEVHIGRGEIENALPLLLRAEQAAPRLPDLHVRIGDTWLAADRLEDAERSFRKAVEIDPDSPQAHLGIARSLLRQGRSEDAAAEALVAVGLDHDYPRAHFVLGAALEKSGQFERAILAFETALSLHPAMHRAHNRLARLYAKTGKDPIRARLHLERFREAFAG